MWISKHMAIALAFAASLNASVMLAGWNLWHAMHANPPTVAMAE